MSVGDIGKLSSCTSFVDVLGSSIVRVSNIPANQHHVIMNKPLNSVGISSSICLI